MLVGCWAVVLIGVLLNYTVVCVCVVGVVLVGVVSCC